MPQRQIGRARRSRPAKQQGGTTRASRLDAELRCHPRFRRVPHLRRAAMAAVYLWRVDDEPSITTTIARAYQRSTASATIPTSSSPRLRDQPETYDPTLGCRGRRGGRRHVEGAVWLSDNVVWRSSKRWSGPRERHDGATVCRGSHRRRPTPRVLRRPRRSRTIAFIIERHLVIPIDPDTGTGSAAAITFPKANLFEHYLSISELVDTRDFAITWCDPVQTSTRHRRLRPRYGAGALGGTRRRCGVRRVTPTETSSARVRHVSREAPRS